MQVKAKGSRKISYTEFLESLSTIADKKVCGGWSMHAAKSDLHISMRAYCRLDALADLMLDKAVAIAAGHGSGGAESSDCGVRGPADSSHKA